MSTIKDDLQSPLAYPQLAPGHVDFIETHISWIFLVGNEVYKVKKPVNLGFLDYSTVDLRKRFCEAEVNLNERLAPGIYRGVVAIKRSPQGVHSIGGIGETVDWAVHMTRLPDEHRADLLLDGGKLGLREIDLLAHHLAQFHNKSNPTLEIQKFGKPELIQVNVSENFEQTSESIQQYLTHPEVIELQNWQLTFITDHRHLFESRILNHRVRDGHGDLRLEQIYINATGTPTILDCIEFNDRFRYADVCSDLAFLWMDLAFHGRVDLAERLLACYARESSDYDLFALVDFYASYRAYSRGKVAHLLSVDLSIPEKIRIRARREAKRYFLLSLSTCRPSLSSPTLIAVGGTLACGKSTVANWLSIELGAPVMDTDRTRKYLLGVPPTQFLDSSFWKGAYDPALSECVYTELFRRAEIVLNSRRTAILDATFCSADMRKKAKELAKSQNVPFRFIECRAPASVCRERLLSRENQSSISDARVQLFDQFSSRFQVVQELSEQISKEEHFILDTSQSFERTTECLRNYLQSSPTTLTAELRAQEISSDL